MSPQRHLVIFVKAPLVGTVKTRLAADIGADAAWRFYRDTTARILRRIGRDRRWMCWLAVTPDRHARSRRYWPWQLARLAQGPGDLGARMARVMRCLPPGPAIIVGSDIPDLTAAHVAHAFRALARHRLVLGPAADGGYWLIGMQRRPPIADVQRADIFRKVRWSSRYALADTLANLPTGWTAGILDVLADIDDGADLVRWRQASHGDS